MRGLFLGGWLALGEVGTLRFPWFFQMETLSKMKGALGQYWTLGRFSFRFAMSFFGGFWFFKLPQFGVAVEVWEISMMCVCVGNSFALLILEVYPSTIFGKDRLICFTYCWWLKSGDPVEVGSISHYIFIGFHTSQVVSRISEPSTAFCLFCTEVDFFEYYWDGNDGIHLQGIIL